MRRAYEDQPCGTATHFPHLVGYRHTEKSSSTRSPHPPSFGWSPFPTGEGRGTGQRLFGVVQKATVSPLCLLQGSAAGGLLDRDLNFGGMGDFGGLACFHIDGDLTVGKYVESVAKAIGTPVKIASYVRFEKGEGIEKRVDDFAAEVAAMAK